MTTASKAPQTSGEWLAAHGTDIVIILSLAALCIVRRIATLEPVNTGGDAAIKAQFVREWFFQHDFRHVEWNHHMTRFGVLVPAYLAQRFMGHGLRGYYTAPIAACVVQVIFVYACGKRLSGRLAGVLAALLLTYTGLMAIAGSQLLPDLFSGTYAIVMTYLYLRYADARGQERLGWLAGCAAVAFAGYLAKETFFFFFPGMALAVWLAAREPHEASDSPPEQPSKRLLRELGFFFGLLLVGFLLETLAYHVFTEYHSRLSIVFASHRAPGSKGETVPDTTFWRLFERYEHLDKPWVIAFYIFLPCWLGLLGFMRNYRVRAVLGVVASFLFCLTFLVRSLNPMLLWQRFMSRYLDPTAPFVELVIGLFVALVIEQLWQQRSDRVVWSRLSGILSHTGAVVLVVCAGLGLWCYSDLNSEWDRNAYTEGTQLAAVANDTYRRDLPLVIRRARAGNQLYARDLETLYAIYMSARDLVRDGRLPPFDEAKRVTSGFTYLVKDPSQYSPAKVSHLMDAGCALEVREQTPFMTASTSSPLPASCDALAAN